MYYDRLIVFICRLYVYI